MERKFFWQGEPIKTQFGYCDVTTNKEKPLWWYNFECSYDSTVPDRAFIPAIRITPTYGEPFCISNHSGIGYHKLINGGWPNCTHFSLPDNFSETHEPAFNIHSFDLEGYEENEKLRRKWQQKNFPEEFEKSERLRKLIK